MFALQSSGARPPQRQCLGCGPCTFTSRRSPRPLQGRPGRARRSVASCCHPKTLRNPPINSVACFSNIPRPKASHWFQGNFHELPLRRLWVCRVQPRALSDHSARWIGPCGTVGATERARERAQRSSERRCGGSKNVPMSGRPLLDCSWLHNLSYSRNK